MAANQKTVKLPPSAIDVEKAVLGACIQNANDFLEVADFLRPEMFFQEPNQIIYSKLCDMSVSGDHIDIINLVSKLSSSKKLDAVGGAYYITELTDNVVNSIDIEYKARIVSQKYMQRKLIELSSKTISDSYDESIDIFETLDNYEMKRDELINHVVTKKEITSEEAVYNTMNELVRRSKLDDLDVTGIDTGFSKMNSFTGGWQPSTLNILAARPAQGKSSLMLKFVLESAKANKHVAVFSLEMSTEKLIERLISMVSEVEINKISKPKLMADHEWQQVHSASGRIGGMPITWDDSPDISVMEIGSKCKRWKRKKDLKMVVIDYLQLIRPSDKKVIREQQISQISRSLKILSKDLDIPVIVLSQLSRECEKRNGWLKRPLLSDLRESGAIEQDADSVMFIFRPEYYELTEDENGNSTAGLAEIIFAKNRSGETGIVNSTFDGSRTKFIDNSGEPEMITDFSFLETDKQMDIPNNDLSRFADFNTNFDDISDNIRDFNKRNHDNDELPF